MLAPFSHTYIHTHTCVLCSQIATTYEGHLFEAWHVTLIALAASVSIIFIWLAVSLQRLHGVLPGTR